MLKAIAPVITMVTEGCAAITTLFRAANKGAMAIESLADVAKDSAGAFADQSKADRDIKVSKMNIARNKALALEKEAEQKQIAA